MIVDAVVVAAWCVTVALAVIGVARVVYDRTRLLTMLNAFSAWLYLPAWPIAIGAFVTGRVALGAVASAVVALHVVLVVAPLTRGVAVARGASVSMRLVTANLRFRNGWMAQLGAELAAYDADVVVLQEVTPAWRSALSEPRALGAYEYRAEAVFDHPGGAVICSRFPLRDVHADLVEGWPLLHAIVEHPAGAFRCVDVHPAPPPYGFARHRAMVGAILDVVRATREEAMPLVVAGDFNLTQYNRALARLRRLGLRNAHEARRRLFATTWPIGWNADRRRGRKAGPKRAGRERIRRRLLPPIRIDHVLASAPFVAVRVEHGRGAGSDHRPVIVEFAVEAGPYTGHP